MTPTFAENADLSDITKNLVNRDELSVGKSADIWGFIFQVTFQASFPLSLLPTRR